MTQIDGAKLLRITFFSGLILFAVSGALFTIFFLIGKNSGGALQQEGFFRMLHEYDLSLSSFYGTVREYDQLHLSLDKLEKKAISVEAWLSILKRRKALTVRHPQSLVNYHRSIDRALNAFPGSAPLNAIAASAAVRDSAVTSEDAVRIRQLLTHISDPSFNLLRLSLHILIGDFKNPQSAASVSPDILTDGSEEITINLAVLKTIRGDYRGAAADIQKLLSALESEEIEDKEQRTENKEQLTENKEQRTENSEELTEYVDYYMEENVLFEGIDDLPAENEEQKVERMLSDRALRFAAEFHYDFGNLERSAEIFSFLNDTSAMSRQADALFLAGFDDIAEYIWNITAQTGVDEPQTVSSLYNLAVIAMEKNNLKDASSFLERLIKINISSADTHTLDCAQYGLIRYSRLQEMPRAAALLQSSAAFPPSKYPYIDLEICKRLIPGRNINRQASETWLLLDRHSENEELYKWAARHFYFQQMYDEIPILIDRFDMLQYSSSWVNFYKALLLMNNGSLQSAETILLSIPEDEAQWYVYANLGRIYEQILSHSRALRQYEAAAAKLRGKSRAGETGQTGSSQQNKNAAGQQKQLARIQQLIAKSYNAQGRQGDAIRALLEAIELDPENLGIKLDLERMMY